MKDKFPGYISWEVYETIQRMLRENYSEYAKKETTGIARKGKALVTGLVYCGACGHKMREPPYHQKESRNRHSMVYGL